MLLHLINNALSVLASLLRFGSGSRAGRLGPRPEIPLLLYDFEACPYCRKVREALTNLDITTDIRPCPKGGTVYRQELMRRGGKAQFPYLVDPNTDSEMYESDAIIDYLYSQYGAARPPRHLRLPVVTNFLVWLAMFARSGQGLKARAARTPKEPLSLWGYEASPGTRLVRELLSVLEIPYRLTPAAPTRESAGKVKVPLLHDPDNRIDVQGTRAILGHLKQNWVG